MPPIMNDRFKVVEGGTVVHLPNNQTIFYDAIPILFYNHNQASYYYYIMNPNSNDYRGVCYKFQILPILFGIQNYQKICHPFTVTSPLKNERALNDHNISIFEIIERYRGKNEKNNFSSSDCITSQPN